MKLLIASIFAATAAFAQTGQICVQPDKTTPAKQVCRDIPAGVRASLTAYVTAQNKPIADANTAAAAQTPPGTQQPLKYQGVADLLFQHLAALFADVVTQNPPPAIQTAITSRNTTDAQIATAKDALVKIAPAADPQ